MPKPLRAGRSCRTLFLLGLGSLLLAGCDESKPPLATTTTTTQNGTAPHLHAEGETAPRNRNERPVPAFDGVTLSGTKLSIGDLLGARIVLIFFNPQSDPAAGIIDAAVTIDQQSGAHNFKVVGIGVGSNSAALSQFTNRHAVRFPVIDDSSGSIMRLMRLRTPNAIFGIDAEGYMSFGIGNFPSDGDTQSFVEAELRKNLRLPDNDTGNDGSLYAYANAPELGVLSMSSGERLEIQDLEGRAAIVIFFLHTCSHCHHALEAIKSILESIPSQQRPRLVAISIQNAPSAIRQALKQQGLDYFEPYLDPGQQATERWGVTGGVPVVIVVDEQGRIRHRSVGWDDQRDPGILKMKAANAAGARVPMLLDPKGYSGNNVCGICHEQEYATWQYTAHSTAFNTLVTHAADRRTDCIGCHVVGFDEPGGYGFLKKPEHLENVGCESCHGRGGPHLTPSFVPRANDGARDYEKVCASCHNPKHSLGFEYAGFHPRISHQKIAALSDAERSGLLDGAGPNRDLLPTAASYVGARACQSCHQAEFKTWEESPHGDAVETLKNAAAPGAGGTTADHRADADCLTCHTTAYGKRGGFVPKVPHTSQADLARVGCESCHGPGGDHVGENTKRVGTILSLGDKCESCVILKICGSCHDDANDPGFPFRVEERIDAQRHGTIEAAATRDTESASLPSSKPGSS